MVLAGAQVVLVDDALANANGQQPGPVRDETSDVRVVDYLQSGMRQLATLPNPPLVAQLTAQSRQPARRVVGHESGHRQFSTGGTTVGRIRFPRSINGTAFTYVHGKELNTPIFGAPHGYGAPQLDPPGGTALQRGDRIWDFVRSLGRSVEIFMVDKAGAAVTDLGGNFPAAGAALNRRQKNIFLRAAVRRYNGGREFVFSTAVGDYLIQPNVGASRRNYPNEVLNTGVGYAAAGAQPAIPFTTADFFL